MELTGARNFCQWMSRSEKAVEERPIDFIKIYLVVLVTAVYHTEGRRDKNKK